eukprot:TRINITY_DN93539_c0_g1_i1.p1 TRINITY_DN93539_c0_g1~~TRINITY_DN93539_c0_g1_i1.p1  ORF type:complete len:306 (+),score=29.06 TRINITY_DN93539_c0_g1_i1:75-920(+)
MEAIRNPTSPTAADAGEDVFERCEPPHVADLPALPKLGEVPTMRGPTRRSNYLIRDKVIVGCYPCMLNANQRRHHYIADLKAIGATGVNVFVCLTAEAPLNRIVYARDVQELFPDRAFRFLYCGIEDCKAFPIESLDSLILSILHELARGSKLYIHCFGGHGRAGIVAACLLGIIYKLNPKTAVEWTTRLHHARDDPCGGLVLPPDSPQTPWQKKQVAKYLEALVRKDKVPQPLPPPELGAEHEGAGLDAALANRRRADTGAAQTAPRPASAVVTATTAGR